ncbi:MAG: hypothetical protein ACRD21_04110, partial [Vicinamibacteria bacterium]
MIRKLAGALSSAGPIGGGLEPHLELVVERPRRWVPGGRIFRECFEAGALELERNFPLGRPGAGRD